MYIGSVRFYKHILLLLLAGLVVGLVTFCTLLGLENQRYRAELGLAREGQTETGMRASAAEEMIPPPVVEVTIPDDPTPPDYEKGYPALYAAPGEVGTTDADRTVYLTFEGGATTYTPRILAALKEQEVAATFFLTGGDGAEETLQAIAAEGHTLGVHTYSGSYKQIYASTEHYLDDFSKAYDLVYEATGAYPQIFRFPGGSVNGYSGGVYREIAAEMTRRGFVYFDWNVSATGNTAKRVTEQALTGVEQIRRPVIRLVEGESTLEALPAIIEGYRHAGYAFAPLTPQVRQVTLG